MENMSIFKTDLGKEYLKFCELRKSTLDTKTLDLSEIKQIFPTNLIPLGIYLKTYPEIDVIPPKDTELSTYIDLLMFMQKNIKFFHHILNI